MYGPDMVGTTNWRLAIVAHPGVTLPHEPVTRCHQAAVRAGIPAVIGIDPEIAVRVGADLDAGSYRRCPERQRARSSRDSQSPIGSPFSTGSLPAYARRLVPLPAWPSGSLVVNCPVAGL